MMDRHILLTADFSEESERAFEPVASLAKALNARVTLLHVVQDQVMVVPPAVPTMPVMKMNPEEAASSARDKLEDLRARFAGAREVVVHAVVASDVAKSIVEQAVQLQADFIAMATHGHSGIKRLLLGSTAENVVRHSIVPVMLYPPPA